jgi:hypothetical protein
LGKEVEVVERKTTKIWFKYEMKDLLEARKEKKDRGDDDGLVLVVGLLGLFILSFLYITRQKQRQRGSLTGKVYKISLCKPY